MGLFSRFHGAHGRVQMLVSVDEFEAGKTYDIPTALADRFIIRGYASGNLSRHYDSDERQALAANHQVVGL